MDEDIINFKINNEINTLHLIESLYTEISLFGNAMTKEEINSSNFLGILK